MTGSKTKIGPALPSETAEDPTGVEPPQQSQPAPAFPQRLVAVPLNQLELTLGSRARRPMKGSWRNSARPLPRRGSFSRSRSELHHTAPTW